MLTPDKLAKVYEILENIFRDRGLIAGKSGRHMKFPYTFSAKIAQFPFFYYCKHNPIWTYYPLGITVAFYFIRKIHNVVNSESNVRSWAETQARIAAREAEAHH